MQPPRWAVVLPTFAAFVPRARDAGRSASRRARRAAQPVLRVALWPPVLGAAYVLAATALSLSEPIITDRERVPGDDVNHKMAWVIARYAPQLRHLEIELLCAAVVFGAALGAVGWGLAAVAARMRRSAPLSRAALALHSLAITATLHAGLSAWSMAKNPQLYDDAWYARGGWRRALQRLVAGAPSPVVILAVVAGAGAGYLAVSALAGRRRGRRDPRPPVAANRRLSSTQIAIGVAAVLLMLGTLGGIPHPRQGGRASPSRPNVLVLAADSFRNDHMNEAITPHLAALARRGTRFTRAYVSTARTFPSWTTLLTGRYPHHHGIRTTFPRHEDRERPFDTIAARFGRAGWATEVVADYGGDIFREADLGFDTVEAPRIDFIEYLGVRVFERGRALLPVLHSRAGRALFSPMREIPKAAEAAFLADDAVAAVHRLADRPFFLVVFFSAPHFPYAAPAPYFKRFTDPSYAGDDAYQDVDWYKKQIPDGRDVAQIRGLYSGAVASVDDAAARVLAAVDREGIAGRTIVVVTADHGEDLFDGGRWNGHGDHLLGDTQNHVPLVIVDPRRPTPAGGREVRDLVRDVDFAPTLCQLAGVDGPALPDGSSLVPALDGERLEPRVAFAETGMWTGLGTKGFPNDWRIPYPPFVEIAEIDVAHHDEIVIKSDYVPIVDFAKHRMVFDGRWKLVYMPVPAGPKYVLYDTLVDPENTTDRSADEPEVVARLRPALWRWMLDDPKMEERGGWLAPRGVHIDAVDGSLARPPG